MSQQLVRWWDNHPTAVDNTGKPRPAEFVEVIDATPVAHQSIAQNVSIAPVQPHAIGYRESVIREIHHHQGSVMQVPDRGHGIWIMLTFTFAALGFLAAFQLPGLYAQVAQLRSDLQTAQTTIQAYERMGAILR